MTRVQTGTATILLRMRTLSKTQSYPWLHHSHWWFVGGSLIAAIVALIAEGPGDFIGFALLCVCVIVICTWSIKGKPNLYWTVFTIVAALMILGWTVEEPEPALFQAILITAAVGWRIDRLFISLGLLAVLLLLPLVASLGPNQAEWGWWNWSVGSAFTWSLGRVIRLLEQTLTELTEARSQLIDSAAREERLRISRDVHDLVGHSLTAMLLNIRAAQRALDSDQQVARQALTDAERVGTTGIADIRSALIEIRDERGIDSSRTEQRSSLPDGEAVMQLLQSQTHISVSSSGDVVSLKGPVAVAVYRLLQECITNCSKYALPESASINLLVEPNDITLNSQNNLRTRNKTAAAISEKTLGLISMRERVNSLGGTFKAGIEGDSWQVHCWIPRND